MTLLYASSHVSAGDSCVGLQFLTYLFLTYLGRFTHQSSLWYLNSLQVKPISSTKDPKNCHKVSDVFCCYKTSSWKKIFAFFDLCFAFLGHYEESVLALYTFLQNKDQFYIGAHIQISPEIVPFYTGKSKARFWPSMFWNL